MATLDPALFASLMQSLEWGLATDVETEVTQRLCLQTMAAMAEHAYRTLQAAQGGQGSAESAAALLGPETQNGRALLAFLSAGDHLLIVDSVYNPTRRFADTMLARLGVEVEYYSPELGADIAALMKPNTKVVWTESPGSNTFEMQDIPAICAVAHAHGAIVMMDNTWATPLFFKSLDHGVDISVHAATKYPGGHSDVLLGTVSANEACWERLHEGFLTLGACAGPDDVYLVQRGLKTMGIRLQRHGESAMALAEWLEGQRGVKQVLHPALPSFPGHDLWKRDFCGASGLFSIVLDGGGTQKAHAFLDALEIFGLGYSWGGHESLAVHVYLGDRTVSRSDYGGPLIRLQIGLEDVADLKADLSAALEAANAAG